MIGPDQVATLRCRYQILKFSEGFRVDPTAPVLIEPLSSARVTRNMPRRISPVTRPGWAWAYARDNVEPHDPPNSCQRDTPRVSRITSISEMRSAVVLPSETHWASSVRIRAGRTK